MAEVRLPELVVRCGGRMFERFGVAAVSGGFGRSLRQQEMVETITRADATPAASYLDRDAYVRVAAAGVLRPHYPPGLVDAAGKPLCGLVCESTRQNKLENGSFEADTAGIGASGAAAFVRDSTQFKHGAWALKVTTTNATSSGVFVRLRSGARPAVTSTSNRRHVWQVWVYAPAASVGKTVKIRIEWWDVTPVFISANETLGIVLVAGWQLLSITAPAATNAVTADVFIGGDAAQGVWDFWIDVADFCEGVYATQPIPTGTAAVTRADETISVPINLDLNRDFTIGVWALVEHSNVASWPDTEPQLDPFQFELEPTGEQNTASTVRLHRQNGLNTYEWEYGSNSPTASRSFTPGVAPQRLTLQHRASDHVLLAAIDGSAFAASPAPGAFTIKPLVQLRLSGNTGFSTKGPDWTLFDLSIAYGLHSEAEMAALPGAS